MTFRFQGLIAATLVALAMLTVYWRFDRGRIPGNESIRDKLLFGRQQSGGPPDQPAARED